MIDRWGSHIGWAIALACSCAFWVSIFAINL